MRAVAPALLAMTLSAVAIAAMLPPFSHAWLAWCALVPVLAVLDRVSPRRAAWLGLLHGTLSAAFVTAWLVPTLREYFDRPLGFTLLFLALFWALTAGVFFSGASWALAWFRERVPRALWLVAVPSCWVAAEFARTHLGLRSPWGTFGDAQFGAERLRQLASLTGIYGLSALCLLGNIALYEAAVALRVRAERRCALAACAVCALCLAAALGFGESRLRTLRAELANAPSLDVALVQANVALQLRWKRSEASRVFAQHAQLSLGAVAGGPPDLIVWPEQALQTSPSDPAIGPSLALLRWQLGAPILLGAVRYGELAGEVFNSAFLLTGESPPAYYDKRRLLPFSETQPLGGWLRWSEPGDLAVHRYVPGRAPGLLNWGPARLGVTLCFEGTYPSLVRPLALGGARMLVNLANDSWFRGTGGAEQHFGQVVFRAVETGLPLLRVGGSGPTAVVLPDGEIRDRLASGVAGVVRARVPLRAGAPTFYTRFGDWLAWLCIAYVAALAAFTLRGAPGE